MLVDIFDFYAKKACSFKEGTKAPPKPKEALDQLMISPFVGSAIREAIPYFIHQHLNYLSKDRNFQESRKRFEKLFKAGIISLEIEFQDILDTKVILKVWDGNQYVIAQEVADEYYEKEIGNDFEETQNFEEGEE